MSGRDERRRNSSSSSEVKGLPLALPGPSLSTSIPTMRRYGFLNPALLDFSLLFYRTRTQSHTPTGHAGWSADLGKVTAILPNGIDTHHCDAVARDNTVSEVAV